MLLITISEDDVIHMDVQFDQMPPSAKQLKTSGLGATHEVHLTAEITIQKNVTATLWCGSTKLLSTSVAL